MRACDVRVLSFFQAKRARVARKARTKPTELAASGITAAFKEVEVSSQAKWGSDTLTSTSNPRLDRTCADFPLLFLCFASMLVCLRVCVVQPEVQPEEVAAITLVSAVTDSAVVEESENASASASASVDTTQVPPTATPTLSNADAAADATGAGAVATGAADAAAVGAAGAAAAGASATSSASASASASAAAPAPVSAPAPEVKLSKQQLKEQAKAAEAEKKRLEEQAKAEKLATAEAVKQAKLDAIETVKKHKLEAIEQAKRDKLEKEKADKLAKEQAKLDKDSSSSMEPVKAAEAVAASSVPAAAASAAAAAPPTPSLDRAPSWNPYDSGDYGSEPDFDEGKAEEYRLLTTAGAEFVKHSKSGKPQPRLVFVTPALVLYWVESAAKRAKADPKACINLALAFIPKINVVKGKGQPNFQRATAAKVPDQLCLSITGPKERNIDLECKTQEQRDAWFAAIKFLLHEAQIAREKTLVYGAMGP